MNVFDFSNIVCKFILPKNDSDFVGVLQKRRDAKVNVTASSTSIDQYYEYKYPQAVVEYDKTTWWTSSNEINQWITLNFSKRMLISNYSIKSDHNPINDDHPKQWKVEGYNEVDGWVEIDVVTESRINGPLLIETRPTYNNWKPFDAVRLTQTGPNWANRYFFRVYKIDFFGIVERKTCERATCRIKKHNIQLIIITANFLSS